MYYYIECSLSPVQLSNPMDCSLPGSSAHGIFQTRYWSGLPFPTPGDPPHPGTEPASPALVGQFFITSGESITTLNVMH